MSDYQTWKQNTLGNHYDIDNSGDYDCVDVPKVRAVDLYGDWVNTIGYGNAKDLFNGASDHYFEKIPNDPNNPNQLPTQGDILVFSPTPYPGYTNTYNNPYGHTGVLDSCDTTGYTLISQSSGTGWPAQLKYNTWRYRHCIGWLRPKDLTPPPPAPEPFTLTDIPEKHVTINRPTHRWNMGYSDLQQMKDNPVESLGIGAGPYTVSVLCHQNGTGYDYYLENRNNLGGFNIYDCSDYVAPYSEPVPEPPAPKVWPSAPANAGSTTPYEVVKLIDGYETSNKAINHIQPPWKPVGAGQYYIFNTRSLDSQPNVPAAINVTQIIGQPGIWINVEDNVPDLPPEPEVIPEPPKPDFGLGGWTPPVAPPPLPTPTPEVFVKKVVINPNWRSSYQTFKDATGHDEERLYIALKDFDMVDQESTNRTAPVKKFDHIWMCGTFIGPDDELYGMPSASRKDKAGNNRYWYYGCPMDRDHVQTEQEVYNTNTTPREREVIKVIQDVRILTNKEKNRQHQLQMKDFLTITPKEIETFVGKAIDFFSGKAKRKTVTINKDK